MNQHKTKCVFGPVPSRRLGLSLGIDLLPYKTCSMDCVYCECGATTDLTCQRKEYFPTEEVIRELDEVMAKKPRFDTITFSGVGEPTLHAGLGKIISHIRSSYGQVRICLLTNATLLNDEGLLKELAPISVIVPSLDGSNEEELRQVNRQESTVTLKTVMSGLLRFRQVYPDTEMNLEVFIVPGVNDSLESAERFRQLIAQIQPTKVQLNSLDRPGAVDWIRPADEETLARIAAVIGQSVPVEIVARHQQQVEVKPAAQYDVSQYNSLLVNALREHAGTARDLVAHVGLPAERIEPHLRRMERAGLLISERSDDGNTIYRAAEP